MTFLVGRDTYDAHVETFTGNASTTAFTLANSTTTNACVVRINGVVQRNGTDFTVSGTTITFTTAPPNASNNVVVQYFGVGTLQVPTDASVTEAKLGSDSVSEAKLKVSNSPTNGTFLQAQSGASGGLTWAEAGGGWEFISTVTADDDADVSFTNMVAGYDYQYRWTNVIPMTNDSGRLAAVLGVTGPTYRTSGYLGTSAEFNTFAQFTSTEQTAFIHFGNNSYDGASPDGAQGKIDLFDPVGSGVTKTLSQFFHRNSGHTFYNGLDGTYYNSAESHTAFKFYARSGNIKDGTFVQYRRKIS